MYIPDWKTEKTLLAGGLKSIIGVDEAGRGPLAGPVVAGAVVLKNKLLLSLNKNSKDGNNRKLLDNIKLIRDSKTLSAKQRERAYEFICQNFYVGVGICDEKTIDRINILEASFLAMKMAIVDLKKKSEMLGSFKILVDGNRPISNFSDEQIAIPQGDKKIKTIAAASIVAKFSRDKIMLKMSKKYPQYGFDKHKGYGTKIHLEMLQRFGPSEIHRRTFAPIKKLCENRHFNNCMIVYRWSDI